MTHYDLTEEAAQDLSDIARYTLNRWGRKQLIKYRNALAQAMDDIASDTLIGRSFSPLFPQVKVIKQNHHFIFYIDQDNSRPLIIAVLHERQEMTRHLSGRFK